MQLGAARGLPSPADIEHLAHQCKLSAILIAPYVWYRYNMQLCPTSRSARKISGLKVSYYAAASLTKVPGSAWHVETVSFVAPMQLDLCMVRTVAQTG